MIKNNKSFISKTRGISLLEILIAISVLLMLGSVSVSVFSDLSNSTSLDKNTNIVASYIDRARGKSINSESASSHGVNLESDRISIFSGVTYSEAGVESSFNIPTESTISSINLSNSASSFYFERLTGIPSATGTITVTSSGKSRIITIYGTGVVDVE